MYIYPVEACTIVNLSPPQDMFSKAIAALLPLLAIGVSAVPAPIPNGGFGVRMNDTPPAYAAVSDCE